MSARALIVQVVKVLIDVSGWTTDSASGQVPIVQVVRYPDRVSGQVLIV